MDTITKQLVVERRKADRVEAKAQKKHERKAGKLLDARRIRAVAQVDEAAKRAIQRTTENSLDWWERYGSPKRVCRVQGPHVGVTCFLHRKTVVLIPIATKAPLWLGSDGKIYRTGQTKYYRAELRHRDRPAQIRRVAKALDKLDTELPPPSRNDFDDYY